MTAPRYVGDDELAEYLRIGGVQDHTQLGDSLLTAEQDVDDYCGWGAGGFLPADSSETKTFRRGSDPYCFEMPYGIHDATGLAIETDDADDGTFSTTWASTDWELAPVDNTFAGVTGFPFFEIRAVGDRTFPTTGRRAAAVRVTSEHWGWAATPDSVYSAVKQRAAALHLRRIKSLTGTDQLTGFRAGGRDRDWSLELDNLRHPRKIVGFA